MNSEYRNAEKKLLDRIEELERTVRRIPSRFASGSPPSYLWVVQGGNTIASIGRQGIALPSPFAEIDPSTLPNGPSGTGIVLVPAYPIPVGLPNGIGVVFKGGSTTSASNYAFLRIDIATSAYIAADIISGEPVFLGPQTTNLDKVSGGTTWRYVCYSARFGGYN